MERNGERKKERARTERGRRGRGGAGAGAKERGEANPAHRASSVVRQAYPSQWSVDMGIMWAWPVGRAYPSLVTRTQVS